MILRPPLRRTPIAAALVSGALALGFASGAQAHTTTYTDPADPDLPAETDIVRVQASHWTASGAYVAPPVIVEHAITTQSPSYASWQRLRFRAKALDYNLIDGAIVREDGTQTGSVQVSYDGDTIRYRFPLSALGNPSSYEWWGYTRPCYHYGYRREGWSVERYCAIWGPGDLTDRYVHGFATVGTSG